MEPYYQDEHTRLFLGDCREVLPTLGLTADVAICDPPYESTSLKWDRWPDGWPAAVAGYTDQMWCFGSFRMFRERGAEFDMWNLGQDNVWDKGKGSGFQADRFRCVHELVVHWYRGRWGDLHLDPRRETADPRQQHRKVGASVTHGQPGHTGKIGNVRTTFDGTRLVQSVIRAASPRGGENTTEKPVSLLSYLVAYSCPPGGLVIEPFAGSGPAVRAARLSGRRSVGVEKDEAQCEALATRLGQGLLFDGEEGEAAEPPPAPVPAPPQTSLLF